MISNSWLLTRIAAVRGIAVCRLAVLSAGVLLCVRWSIAADRHSGNPAKPPEYSDFERSHWAFQKPKLAPVPRFTGPLDRRWLRTPVDAFILRKLTDAKLQPAPPAERPALIRRLYFDLLGVPPTPEEIDEFDGNQRPDAYERLVERLLADPRYGERWAQHWLDVVRFAESEGFEYDRHRPGAWRYRDYVIRSFNADKPYTRFITEQLAGDELQFDGSRRGLTTSQKYRDARIAVAFHRLGPVRRNAGNAEVAFSRNEVLTEMTDAVGSTFLGLTIGCARCHDHKFDPIRQRDYYRLQAFLAGTQEYEIPLSSSATRKQWELTKAKLEAEVVRIKKQLGAANAQQEKRLQRELAGVEAQLAQPPSVIFTTRNDRKQRTPIHLLIRGDEFTRGQKLGMRLPGVFLPEDAPELAADLPRPKTRLARWIASADNPLTARVMVNRIWQYHFGTGIVSTSNDFGFNGSEPSHPQLLDWLAREFVRKDWSVKALHRVILLSNTYRQSSQSGMLDVGQNVDPENRLLWKFPRRRLDAEQIRDAMLQVSGVLNRKAGGRSVMVPVDAELVALLYKPSQWQVTADRREHDRRSVYLIAKRNLRVPFLEVFDQPNLQTSCFLRNSSTHAPQALELLNGQFSNRMARRFAERLRREAGRPEQQVELGFRLVAGRPPTLEQKRLSLAFLRTEPLEEFALALFSLNSFLYVE